MRTAYLTIVPVILMATCAAAQPAQVQARAPTLEYPSVAAALESVRSKNGVKVEIQSGWTIVHDEPNMTVWSFTPPNHPAYPTALRRTVVEQDGGFVVKSDAMCEAAKTACDRLMVEVEELDKRMIEAGTKK
jgi:hypothetical protein